MSLSRIIFCTLFSLFIVGSATAKPFLELKRERAQCKVLKAWFEDMDRMAGPGLLSEENTGRDQPIEYYLIEAIAPMYADQVFRPVVGKGYFELNSLEARKIQRGIWSCIGRMGTLYVISDALIYRNPQTDWGKAVTAVNSDPRPVEVQMAERRKTRETREAKTAARLENFRSEQARKAAVATEPREHLPYFAGQLLKQGIGFRVHEFRFSNHDVDTFCPPEPHQLGFSIVLSDHDTVLDESYIEAFFADVLEPLRSRVCPTAKQINAHFFFEGVHLNGEGAEISESDVRSAQFRDDRWFAVARKSYQDYASHRISVEYFHNAVGSQGDLYQTLDGLRELAARHFLTPEGYAAQQARFAEYRYWDDQVGGTPYSRRVRILLYGGKESKNYFRKRRANWLAAGDIVAPLFAYSSVMRNECPNSTPGGMTMATYTATRDGVVVEEDSFLVPKDFYPAFEYLVRSDRVVGERGRGNLYTSFNDIVSYAGCRSAAVQRVHNSIKESLDTIYP